MASALYRVRVVSVFVCVVYFCVEKRAALVCRIFFFFFFFCLVSIFVSFVFTPSCGAGFRVCPREGTEVEVEIERERREREEGSNQNIVCS